MSRGHNAVINTVLDFSFSVARAAAGVKILGDFSQSIGSFFDLHGAIVGRSVGLPESEEFRTRFPSLCVAAMARYADKD